MLVKKCKSQPNEPDVINVFDIVTSIRQTRCTYTLMTQRRTTRFPSKTDRMSKLVYKKMIFSLPAQKRISTSHLRMLPGITFRFETSFRRIHKHFLAYITCTMYLGSPLYVSNACFDNYLFLSDNHIFDLQIHGDQLDLSPAMTPPPSPTHNWS